MKYVRKTKDVICRRCGKPQRVPKNTTLASFGRSGIVCGRKQNGHHCLGEFRNASE